MAVDRKRLVSLLLKESAKVEPRCPGYAEELQNVLVEILRLEREHATRGTHIRKKIAEQCADLGTFLMKNS